MFVFIIIEIHVALQSRQGHERAPLEIRDRKYVQWKLTAAPVTPRSSPPAPNLPLHYPLTHAERCGRCGPRSAAGGDVASAPARIQNRGWDTLTLEELRFSDRSFTVCFTK